MKRALLAGVAYFGIVFVAGFVLGIVRTLVVQPVTGPLFAVACELPLILGFAWFACGRLARALSVPALGSHRAAMGGVAFGLLMAAEIAVSVFLAGRSVSGHLALYREASHLLGLAGQLAFALFPLWQSAVARPGSRIMRPASGSRPRVRAGPGSGKAPATRRTPWWRPRP